MNTRRKRKAAHEEPIAEVLRIVGGIGLLVAAFLAVAGFFVSPAALYLSLAGSLGVSCLLFFACARGLDLLAAINRGLADLRYEPPPDEEYDDRRRERERR